MDSFCFELLCRSVVVSSFPCSLLLVHTSLICFFAKLLFLFDSFKLFSMAPHSPLFCFLRTELSRSSHLLAAETGTFFRFLAVEKIGREGSKEKEHVCQTFHSSASSSNIHVFHIVFVPMNEKQGNYYWCKRGNRAAVAAGEIQREHEYDFTADAVTLRKEGRKR